jgi:hypothetical protein
MHLVWNQEGVRIHALINVRWVGDVEAWICGSGTYKDREFTWEAKPLSGGWFTDIYSGLGRVGSLQGVTFNLPLEVATAARRIL